MQLSMQNKLTFDEDVVSVDIETTPIKSNNLVDKIWCISWEGDNIKGSVSWQDGVTLEALTEQFANAEAKAKMFPSNYLDSLLELRRILGCEDGQVPAFHSAQFDKRILGKCMYIPKYYCTQQLAYVLMPPALLGSTGDEDALRFYSLAALAKIGLCSAKADYNQGWEKFSEEMLEYNKQDASSTNQLRVNLFSMLDPESMNAYLIDMCAMETIIHMAGVTIDQDALRNLFLSKEVELDRINRRMQELCPALAKPAAVTTNRKKQLHELTTLKRGIYDADDAGKFVYLRTQGFNHYYIAVEKFSATKTRHVAEALKWVHGWEPKEFTKAGNPKLDKTVINDLAEEYEFAHLVKQHRKVSKLLSTYLKPYKESTDEFGKLYPSFPLCATRTGRLASRDPNFQNVPKEDTRKLVVAPEGYQLVCVDLSQIELRILGWYMYSMLHGAHKSASYLWDAYHARRDVHNENQKMMELEERRDAKIGMFLYVYGGRAHRLSKSLNKSMVEAERIIKALERNAPALPALVNVIIGMAKTRSVLRTYYGHKVVYPDLKSKDQRKSSAAERQYFNAMIQGTQADIIKVLMWQCRKPCEYYGAQMLAQVHDELLFQVPNGNIRAFCEALMPLFNNVELLPGLPVEGVPGVGSNWEVAKKDGDERAEDYKEAFLEARKFVFNWEE